MYSNIQVSWFINNKNKSPNLCWCVSYVLLKSGIFDKLRTKRIPQLCWTTGLEQGNGSAFIIHKWYLLGFYALKGMPYNERNGMSSLYKLQVFLFNVNCFFFNPHPILAQLNF